jgi:hypothetical protein
LLDPTGMRGEPVTRAHDAMMAGRGSLAGAVYGALGGLAAAGCMTALRDVARRAGLIEKPVPQAVEEWLADRAGLGPDDTGVVHHVAEHLLHTGYSAAWGAAAGALLGPGRGSVARQALLVGLGVWAVGFLGPAPALRILRSPAQATPGERAANIGAHLLYGAVTMLIADGLARQGARRPTADAERLASRVG